MFAGFPPEALTFYSGLEADNSKAYWEAHRDVYEDAVREPLEELIAEVGPEFGTAKVFRPYRDVRFSKDKSPYKTAAAAVMVENGHAAAARYVQVGANGLWCGGGLYEPDRGQLQRIRRAIADQPGAELAGIIQNVEAAGLSYMEPELKTAPRGYPKDHPRIDLLRRKRHAAIARHEPGAWLHGREALDRIVADWRAITPLLDWLERHAGPAEEIRR